MTVQRNVTRRTELLRFLPGRHEVERIPHPDGFNCNWLVPKGTKIGAAETFWRNLQDANRDWKVVIEE